MKSMPTCTLIADVLALSSLFTTTETELLEVDGAAPSGARQGYPFKYDFRHSSGGCSPGRYICACTYIRGGIMNTRSIVHRPCDNRKKAVMRPPNQKNKAWNWSETKSVDLL